MLILHPKRVGFILEAEILFKFSAIHGLRIISTPANKVTRRERRDGKLLLVRRAAWECDGVYWAWGGDGGDAGVDGGGVWVVRDGGFSSVGVVVLAGMMLEGLLHIDSRPLFFPK
jgi:hypothetical protein